MQVFHLSLCLKTQLSFGISKLKIHSIRIIKGLNNGDSENQGSTIPTITQICEIHNFALPYSGKVGELTRFEHLAKESLENYKSANRLLIVSTNLNGFSLANRRRFAKFIKLSPY